MKRITFFVLMLTIMAVLPAFGQPVEQQHQELAASEVQSFVNEDLPQLMQQWHIPGLAITIVHKGQIVMSQGYGWADIDRKIPVDAAATVFRVGSITKLFTATAVAQLIEQNQIGLSDPVTPYLHHTMLKNTFKQPVTVKELLTHTAGIVDSNLGLFTYDPASVKPLALFLTQNPAHVAVNPGVVHIYSNYSYTIAGHLIERVSKVSYPGYIKANILRPLRMKQSSIFINGDLPKNTAQGYDYNEQEGYITLPPEYINIYPAGGLITTAYDMAAFMIAQLQNGRYNDTHIFQQQAADLLQHKQFSYFPEFSGVGAGFFITDTKYGRLLWHNGGLRGFGSWMFLYPDKDLGIFITYNRFDFTIDIAGEFLKRFLQKFYPQAQEKVLRPPSINEDVVTPSAGSYLWLKPGVPHYTFERLLSLWAVAQVRFNNEEVINVQFPGIAQPLAYQKLSKGIYQLKDQQGIYAAFMRKDKKQYMITEDAAYVRLAWYEHPGLHLGVFLLCLMGILISSLAWLISLAKEIKAATVGIAYTLRTDIFLLTVSNGLYVIFSVAYPLVFFTSQVYGACGIPNYMYGLSLSINLIGWILLLAVGITALLSLRLKRIMKILAGSLLLRIIFIINICSILGIVLLLYLYNLLGIAFA